MRRRARVARLLIFAAAVVASGAAVVALADDGSSDSARRDDANETTVSASSSVSTLAPTTIPVPTSFPDLGLPPLPPFPTLVPDGGLDAVPASTGAGAVAVFGDSLTLQAWPYLQAIADHQGRALFGASYGGAALCDWFPTMQDVLLAERPTDLVLAFAGNNLTPCVAAPDGERAWGTELVGNYVRDATHAIGLARATGARVTLVGPPDMDLEPQAMHARLLREAFEQLADDLDVAYVDAGDALSADGFDSTQPCLPFETVELGCSAGRIVVREDDGVHLSSPGEAGYSAGAWRYSALLLAG